jgi:hypothetical protein
MNEKDWRTAAALFVLISSVYFATVAGITSSNDGSHYALVRALVDQHRFEISEYLGFTENQDYALFGDRRFSDRPPGTALIAAPVYALSAFLPGPLAAIHSKHDSDNPRVIYAMLAPVAAAAATAILLYWILRAHFKLSPWATTLATLAFAFGTMTWKYGSLLYSHATSGLAVMAATALMLKWTRREAGWRDHFGLGLILGLSVLMEYTNILFAVLAWTWWVWHTVSALPRPVSAAGQPGRAVLAAALGPLVPAAFLMWYNLVNFGSPFALSTFHADTTRWPQNASFFTDFATPIWVGLPAMLFYGHDNQGLFWLAPVALVGGVGLKALWDRSRREFFLIAGGFAAMLLLFSTSTTFNPATNDGRYITPFLGLWFVAVGVGLARIETSRLLSALAYGLLFLSIRNQVMHIAFSWGHDLNPAALRPWSAAPENILAVWRAVLPNVLNVPLWWGMLGMAWLGWQLMRRRAAARPAPSTV